MPQLRVLGRQNEITEVCSETLVLTYYKIHASIITIIIIIIQPHNFVTPGAI